MAHNGDVSLLRLYLLRAMYLVNFVAIGLGAWPALIHPDKPLAVVPAAAFSMYAALSTLSALGLRYPLKMLPLLLMQLFYKTVWLLVLGISLFVAGDVGAPGVMLVAAIADILVIPWRYVLSAYVMAPGDRWTVASPRSAPSNVKPRSI